MIQFIEVSVGYGEKPVVRDVSFSVPDQAVTSLVGPNGCGKTTLLKTACGLLAPAKGQVTVDGRPIGDYGRRELARQVALLPQVRETPAITVERLTAHGRYPHLGMGRRLSGQDSARMEQAMEGAGVLDLRHRELATLSGGERQRAYIAMSLSQDSRALLLDEPTTYLDIGQKYQMLELICQMKSRGKTVLAVLHDLSLAFAYSDFIAVMAEGRLVRFAPPREAAEAAAEVFGVGYQWMKLGDREHCVFYS